MEADVDCAGPGQLPDDLQADLLGDLDRAPSAPTRYRARSVYSDPSAVPQAHGDAVVVLLVAQVLGGEGDLRAARGGVLDQERLHVGLGTSSRAQGLPEVVAEALVPGAPGAQPGDLGSGQAGGEEGVAHPVPRRGDFLASSSTPRSRSTSSARWLVMWARGVLASQFHCETIVHAHPVGGQRQRGGGAHGAGADDEDVGVEIRGVPRTGAGGGVQQVGGAGNIGEVLCHEVLCHVCFLGHARVRRTTLAY